MTLNAKQQQLIEVLQSGPVTYKEIADALDVSLSTARDHMSELGSENVEFQSRYDGQEKVFDIDTPSHPTETERDFSEQTRYKQQKTRKLNEHMRGMEQRLQRLLEDSEPAVADGGLEVSESHEDVVIHRTDAHFGDVVCDEFGNEVFNSDIAEQREKEVTDKAIELVERQQQAGIEYDTAHLLLGGDMVTGENVYSNQQSEIRETLDEQIDRAYEVCMDQIKRLAERFATLQVVCQPGNHGALEASYSSGANADRLLYMMLDKSVRMDSGLENVTFIRNDSTNFTNFHVRGGQWKFHLRHGDNSLEHIGTSSGKKRWYNWMLTHNFDQGYRGHYHTFEIDTVHDNTKVVMTGSPKPSDDFEESIAEWTAASATVHGVSDRLPMTWIYPVEFTNN